MFVLGVMRVGIVHSGQFEGSSIFYGVVSGFQDSKTNFFIKNHKLLIINDLNYNLAQASRLCLSTSGERRRNLHPVCMK